MYLGFSNATESKRVHREVPIDNNFLHSNNVLRLRFLELATSFLGARRLRQEKSLINRKRFETAHFFTSTNPF